MSFNVYSEIILTTAVEVKKKEVKKRVKMEEYNVKTIR